MDVAGAWLEAGIRLVQLRAKNAASGRMLEIADGLVKRARDTGAIVIINDRADVAAMAGAAGVHVGQDDLSPADVRTVVGAAAVVGLSTHSEPQVIAACGEPIDYLAIGPVFASRTRPDAHAIVSLDGVAMAARHASRRGLPVVAIGGITLDEAPRVIDAGATAVAVVSGLFDGEPRAIARNWIRALDSA